MTPTVVRSGPIPPLTLITDTADDVALARAARCWANPRGGRITVDPTPATLTSAFLARDILAALGRTAYAPTSGRVITAQPAWRAVACWTVVDNIHQLAVLRAHLLTPDRAEQLSVLRELTGIRLILMASGATAGESARLKAYLAEAGLAGELEHLDAPAALSLFTQGAAPRPNPSRPRPVRPRTSTTRFSGAAPACGAPPARRTSPDLSGQHRAGLLAARNWLSRHRATLPTLPDQCDVEFFLSRLTALSPTPEHTATRIHGAQDGFAAAGLRLAVPADPAATGGPGICTVPFTADVARRISRAVPGPAQAAALAALLCTGAAADRLVMATVDDVHHDGSRLTLPGPFGGDHDQDDSPPRVCYAIPTHARPYLQAARLFRQLEGAPGHFHLFSKSFGYRFKALVKDGGHPIPTLDHPHPGPPWHHQARLLPA
ncbi:hypothetical protein AB0I84_10840 [Streptomyces spectabilis]|uniref:hypothetical protein n=1 Tax=Streptomyces spectabilis TaxID=68270 RepID=UPI0033F83804